MIEVSLNDVAEGRATVYRGRYGARPTCLDLDFQAADGTTLRLVLDTHAPASLAGFLERAARDLRAKEAASASPRPCPR